MKRGSLTITLATLVLVAGCDDALTVEPVNEVSEERAITDARTARAALEGAYDALQDDEGGWYAGGDVMIFGDLPSDDVFHSGTFGSYAEADLNEILPQNASIEGMWEQLYEAIGRANVLIARIPTVPGLSEEARDNMIGQAHFLRALHYHHLSRLWGGVPLRLEPVGDLDEAAQITRSSLSEVQSQILADLTQAGSLISNRDTTRRATRGAVWALRTRVYLDQGDWAKVVEAADSVNTFGYSLTPNFATLFDVEGTNTSEDIFRVGYTASEANSAGWYYRSKGVASSGRFEVAPTCALVAAFDADINCAAPNYALFNPSDARGSWTIKLSAGTPYGSKYPTGSGTEDLHILRYAEVILNRAEALARLNRLAEAVTEYNKTRVRAGLAAHVLNITDIDPGPGINLLDTQDEVLEQVWLERRLELAFEGHRWPDIVRTGRAVALLELDDPDNPRVHQVLFPIPQAELDASPRLTQNPGY